MPVVPDPLQRKNVLRSVKGGQRAPATLGAQAAAPSHVTHHLLQNQGSQAAARLPTRTELAHLQKELIPSIV